MRGEHQCAEICDIFIGKTGHFCQLEGQSIGYFDMFSFFLTAELRGASRGDQTPRVHQCVTDTF